MEFIALVVFPVFMKNIGAVILVMDEYPVAFRKNSTCRSNSTNDFNIQFFCFMAGKKVLLGTPLSHPLPKIEKYLFQRLYVYGATIYVDLLIQPLTVNCSCETFELIPINKKFIFNWILPKEKYPKLQIQDISATSRICVISHGYSEYKVHWSCNFGTGFIALGNKNLVENMNDSIKYVYSKMVVSDLLLSLNVDFLFYQIICRCSATYLDGDQYPMLKKDYKMPMTYEPKLSISTSKPTLNSSLRCIISYAQILFNFTWFCEVENVSVQLETPIIYNYTEFQMYIYRNIHISYENTATLTITAQTSIIICECIAEYKRENWTLRLSKHFFLPLTVELKILFTSTYSNKTYTASCVVSISPEIFIYEWRCYIERHWLTLESNGTLPYLLPYAYQLYLKLKVHQQTLTAKLYYQNMDVPCTCTAKYKIPGIFETLEHSFNLPIIGLPNLKILPKILTLPGYAYCDVSKDRDLFSINIFINLSTNDPYNNYILKRIEITNNTFININIRHITKEVWVVCRASSKHYPSLEASSMIQIPDPLRVFINDTHVPFQSSLTCFIDRMVDEFRYIWTCFFKTGTFNMDGSQVISESLYEKYIYSNIHSKDDLFTFDAIIMNGHHYTCRCTAKHIFNIFPNVSVDFRLDEFTEKDIYFEPDNIKVNETFQCLLRKGYGNFLSYIWFCIFGSNPVQLGLQFESTRLPDGLRYLYNSITVRNNTIFVKTLSLEKYEVMCYCKPFLVHFIHVSDIKKWFALQGSEFQEKIFLYPPSGFKYFSNISCYTNDQDIYYMFTWFCLFGEVYIRLGKEVPIDFRYGWLHQSLVLLTPQRLFINISFAIIDLKCLCIARSLTIANLTLQIAFKLPFNELSNDEMSRWKIRVTNSHRTRMLWVPFAWFILLVSIFLGIAFRLTLKYRLMKQKLIIFTTSTYYDSVKIVGNGFIKMHLISRRYNCLSTTIVNFLKRHNILKNWMDINLEYHIRLKSDIKLYDFLEGNSTIPSMTPRNVSGDTDLTSSFNRVHEIIAQSPVRRRMKAKYISYKYKNRKEALFRQYKIVLKRGEVLSGLTNKLGVNQYLNPLEKFTSSDDLPQKHDGKIGERKGKDFISKSFPRDLLSAQNLSSHTYSSRNKDSKISGKELPMIIRKIKRDSILNKEQNHISDVLQRKKYIHHKVKFNV